MIRDLVYNNMQSGGRIELGMSEPVYAVMVELTVFLYDNVFGAHRFTASLSRSKKY